MVESDGVQELKMDDPLRPYLRACVRISRELEMVNYLGLGLCSRCLVMPPTRPVAPPLGTIAHEIKLRLL